MQALKHVETFYGGDSVCKHVFINKNFMSQYLYNEQLHSKIFYSSLL